MEYCFLKSENFFNSYPDALIILDKEYRIQGFNKIADYTAQSIIKQKLELGNSILQYFFGAHAKNLKLAVDQALQGKIIEYDSKFTITGTVDYWYEFTYNPILGDNQDILGVSITAKPIKKRKVTEEILTRRLAFEQLVSKISTRFTSISDINHAINLSLEDLGQFSEAKRAYIFQFSNDGTIIDNTHEWCADGVLPEIKTQKQIQAHLFPWWMEKLQKGEIIFIKDVSTMTAEASIEKETLEAQGIDAVVVLPIYVQRKIVGFIGLDNVISTGGLQSEDLAFLKLTAEIFSNAFERLEAEQALKASEKKFRELFHNVNDIICVHSLEEDWKKIRFIEVNDFTCKKTGYSREEALTMTASDIYTPELAALIPTIQENLKKLGHAIYEMNYLAKDGTKIPLEIHSHLFMLNGEQVVMTIGRDITERMLMEKELKQNNSELQEIIYTLKETQSRLIQQEQLAGIGQLAAGVAHEINNPLAFTMSNCHTLKKYLQSLMKSFDKYKDFSVDLHSSLLPSNFNQRLMELEKQHASGEIIDDLDEILNDILTGLERVDKIVKGLSAFSRIDQQNELKDFDLHAGINNTLIVALNEYKYHTEIEASLNPIPLLKGNAGQINQVLLNLLLNAAYAIKSKASPVRGVIKISTFYDEKFVYCEIEDNGIGIPEDKIGKIFNPFFTTKPVGEGTGLGLSIVYDIMVNKHQGEVEVASTLGQGTLFTLKFPL